MTMRATAALTAWPMAAPMTAPKKAAPEPNAIRAHRGHAAPKAHTAMAATRMAPAIQSAAETQNS